MLNSRAQQDGLMHNRAGCPRRSCRGGETATDIDLSDVGAEKVPSFTGVAVLLALLLLMAVFRSLLIPLLASVMNLLPVGAALGALNAVFS